MKRILLPFFLFASAVQSHPGQIMVRHPQAEVDYFCQPGQNINSCIATACSYATPYSCRIISRNQNVYFIETYIPPNFVSPVVVVPSPVFVTPPVFIPPLFQVTPLISVFPQYHVVQQNAHHHPRREVQHRPRRR